MGQEAALALAPRHHDELIRFKRAPSHVKTEQ